MRGELRLPFLEKKAMSRIIELNIDNEWIRGAGVFAGATGSHDDVILRMKFSEMWDGMAKTVEFLDANHENAIVKVIGNAEQVDINVYDVTIPAKAKEYSGKMAVTIKGAKTANNVETEATMSVYGEFEIKESLWSSEAETAADVTPTMAEQLAAEIAAINAQVVGMTVSAETLDATEDATVTKSLVNNHYNLHFGIPRGTPGISVQAGAHFGFYISSDGHLHVVYEDTVEPAFEIDENGHLIMTLED